jgi:threonine synthase
VYNATGYVLDPHTAVGVAVGDRLRNSDPLICLATAHPAKFPDALKLAIGIEPTHPLLEALKGAPTKCDKLAAETELVRGYLERKLS